MSFWDKYGKYFKMGIYLTIYLLITFTDVFNLIFSPLFKAFGPTKLGYSSYVIILNVSLYLFLFCISLFLIPDIYYLDFMIFKKKSVLRKVLEIVISFQVLLFASAAGSILTMMLGETGDSVNEQSIDSILTAFGSWAYIPVAVVIGPIVEETIFRGVLQGTIIGPKFQKRSSPRVILGIIIPAIIFGLIHVVEAGDYIQIFSYLFMGIALGIIAYETKSIYVSAIVHILNNLIACMLPFLAGGLLWK